MSKKDEAKLSPLPPGKSMRAEYARSHFCVEVPSPTPKEHVLIPTFWAHYSKQLRPGDIVSVKVPHEDAHFDLIVTEIGVQLVKVRLFPYNAPDMAKVAELKSVNTGDLQVQYCPGGSPPEKWRVLKTVGTEKVVISKGHDSKEAAWAAAKAYEKQAA